MIRFNFLIKTPTK